MKTIETAILSNLLLSQEFVTEFLPHLDPEYMTGAQRVLLQAFIDYYRRFHQLPSKASLETNLQHQSGLTEQQYRDATTVLACLHTSADPPDWLYTSTDEWIAKQAEHNAVRQIIDNMSAKEEGRKMKGEASPVKIMAAAAEKGRQHKVGLNFQKDASSLLQLYQQKASRIPFDLAEFNRFTAGGIVRKSMMGLMAGTGVGKSLFMCHFAAGFVSMGFKVLYITLEMARERIAERIDANLLDVPVTSLSDMLEAEYLSRRKTLNLPENCLFIEEYSPYTAGSTQFNVLLKKLKQRDNFKPDIIIVDYINICGSSSFKRDNFMKQHIYLGSVITELSALAKEHDVALITATQMNREGYKSTEPGVEHSSQSAEVPNTMDYWVVIQDDEKVPDHYRISVPKVRYDARPAPFTVRVDRSRMRLYDAVPDKQSRNDRYTKTFSHLLEKANTTAKKVKNTKARGDLVAKPNRTANVEADLEVDKLLTLEPGTPWNANSVSNHRDTSPKEG